MKEIMDNLDFMKIKNFCSAKENFKRKKKTNTDWEKVFAKDTYDKGILSKYTKNSQQLENK